MHPVTAHGFNLGLKGLEIITKEIKSAIERLGWMGVLGSAKECYGVLRSAKEWSAKEC